MAVELETLMTGNVQYLAPAYSDIIIRAKGMPNDIYDNKYNVKYICKVYIDGVLAATLKAIPDTNLNRRAHFRIHNILQDYTSTDKLGFDSIECNSTFEGSQYIDNPHSIHQIDKFARNRANLKTCLCIGGYEYSNTINGEILEVTSINTEVGFLYFNSVLQHVDGFSSQDFSDYLLTGVTKRFLTIFPRNIDNIVSQKIQLGQYHTVAFLNGNHYLDSEVTGISISTFDSNNTLIEAQAINNTTANGGAPFGTTIGYNLFQNTTNVDEGLLYFGCGTAQLEELGFDMTNVADYYVVAINGVAPCSASYRFQIQDADCKGYETIRLAFLNRLGAWDYYNFNKRSVRTTEITRSAMKQNYGHTTEYSTSFAGALQGVTTYNQGTYDGGTRTFNVNAIQTIEANTDFITEDEASLLEELFTSVDVYMQTGNNFEPVVISETQYVKQTTANDKLIQYIISIEKGHNTRVQRL